MSADPGSASAGPDRAPPKGPTRRGVLRRAAVGTVAAAGVGAATAGAQEQEPYDGWFTGDAKGDATDNYDGTVDMRGEDSVTVEVGADGNGGTFAYEPAAVRVDPGTEIVFEWTSDTHNVVVEEQPGDASWEGHEPIEDTDFSFSATLDVEGVYKYYCDPHLSLGMKGAVVVGDADVGEGGGGGGEARPDWGGWLDDVDGGYEDLRGNEEVTVAVGAEGNDGFFAFEPAGIWIDEGTTVRWEWTGEGGGHNVVEREGDFDLDSGDPVTEAGVNYENTFEEGGISKYVCVPHESLGMLGAVAVGDDVPTKEPAQAPGPGETGDGDDDGGIITNLPGGQVRSMILLTTLGFLGAAAALVLSGELWNSLQQGRGRAREAAAETGGEVVAAPVEEPTRELDHDSFVPRGTWTLVLVYLLILVAMWVFTYFVEFLGRGPTVVG